MPRNGWHRGEDAIHRKLNYHTPMASAYTWVQSQMPDPHREFHTTCLPFIPVTTLDALGRPWGSILAGHDGKTGFVTSPDDTTLLMDVKVWEGDPFLENASLFDEDRGMLVAGIGVQVSTRRRNKFAGRISKLTRRDAGKFHLELTINQVFQNCPKYITIRDLVPHPDTAPKVVSREPQLPPTGPLPEDILSFIRGADTLFLGTSYVAPEEDKHLVPSHVGMNHRGGLPGFVRIMPSDGRTLVLPDFSGDRMMTSLGNIEATGLASLTFLSFTTGDILYTTGTAQTLIGPAARHLMPLQNTLTTIHIDAYTLVHTALPLRQRPNSPTARSPYTPPLRLLAAEPSPSKFFPDAARVSATLTSIAVHSLTLATFTWAASTPVHIAPGQAAILDFTPVLGPAAYQHLDPSKPTAVNDDRIRTWTVSSAHPCPTHTFALTVREKRGGVVSGSLFNFARGFTEEVLGDTRALGYTVRFVGISGDFVLPREVVGAGPKRLLWVAGGIGVTPYLSMLSALADPPQRGEWDIALVLSTREPEVLLPLVLSTLQKRTGGARIRLAIDVFSDEPVPELGGGGGGGDVVVRAHAGRVHRGVFLDGGVDVGGREVYVCGPEEFEEVVVGALKEAGVDSGKVRREGFGY